MKLLLVLLVLACVTFGCASPDLELSAEEQATWNGGGEAPGEVIPVEGTAPPGPFDPEWEGPNSGAPGNQGEPSEGGGAAGGGEGGGGGGPSGGGGGAGEPEPIPERKICRKEMGEEACLDCCMWNHLHVDTPKCAEVPRRKRRKCREEATEELANCQVQDCDRHGIPPIVTIVAPQ